MVTDYRSGSAAAVRYPSTEPKPSRWQIWPLNNFVEGPERNIHDSILLAVWAKMEETGRDIEVFYNGFITNSGQWLDFIKEPSNVPVLVYDAENGRFAAVAWLNGVNDGFAFAHYCFLEPFSRGVARQVLDYWQGFQMPNGEPVFRALLGITPKTHTKALRVMRILGFKECGEIPDLCHMAYHDERVPGVLSYYKFKGD